MTTKEYMSLVDYFLAKNQLSSWHLETRSLTFWGIEEGKLPDIEHKVMEYTRKYSICAIRTLVAGVFNVTIKNIGK